MGIQINGQTDTVTATDGSINIGGDVTVPGVLTYEDVTSVDAVGLSTFQNGIHVTGGNIGVNNTNPQSQLHVTNSSTSTISLMEDGASGADLVYDGSTNYFSIKTGTGGAGSQTTRLTIQRDNGNIGIGTDNPGAKTHIDSTTSNTPLVVEASQNNRSRLVFRNNQETGTQCTIELIDEDLRFNTNSGERMRIVRDGNIGIGITNPTAKFELSTNNAGAVQNNVIRFTDTDASFQAGQSPGRIEWNTSDANSPGVTAYIDTYGYTNAVSDLVFGTGAGGSATERLRILHTGNIGIGTDAASNKVSILVPNETSLGSNSDGIKVWDATKQLQLSRTGSSYSYDGVTGTGSLIYSYDKLSLHADTSNPITFATGGSERLRITGIGSVGIGNTNPEVLLHLLEDNTDPYNTVVTHLKLSNGGGNQGSGNRIEFQTGIARCWIQSYINGPNSNSGGDLAFGTPSTGTLGTERVRITSDGKFGINTVSPTSLLSVSGGTDDDNFIRMNNEEVGILFGSWGTGSSYPRECTLNSTRVDNGTSPFLRLAGQGGIKFAVDLNSVRGSILSTGEFRIGTTSQVTVSTDKYHSIGDVNLSGNTSNLARLVMQERSGDWISFKNGSGVHYGTISINSPGVNYGSNSDYRLKDNVENFSGGIDLIKRLRPVTFNWNELSGNEDTTSTQRGFLAHEVQEVEPAAVTGEKDEMDRYGDCYDAEGRRTQINVFEHQAEEGETWTLTSEHIRDQQLDPAKLVPILTAALKESIAKIESLEARLDAAGL